MKSTGIFRQVDVLGRVVIPIELRRAFDLKEKDAIEIYTEDDMIILKKVQRSCVFCNSSENVIEYKGKPVCAKCLEELKNGK